MTDEGIKNVLNQESVLALLASSTKPDATNTRDISTWFKLNQLNIDTGCANPNCADPRSKDDIGRNIVSKVKGQFMCRHCFLAGWLLDG